MNSTTLISDATKTIQNIKPKTFISSIQKRQLSKQLLSQIHFCRFVYKLISSIDIGLSYEISLHARDELILFLYFKLW